MVGGRAWIHLARRPVTIAYCGWGHVREVDAGSKRKDRDRSGRDGEPSRLGNGSSGGLIGAGFIAMQMWIAGVILAGIGVVVIGIAAGKIRQGLPRPIGNREYPLPVDGISDKKEHT